MVGGRHISGVDIKELKMIVEKRGVAFQSGKVPNELLKAVENKDIIVLGEHHYVQQHHEFLTHLAKELHNYGYRQILSELMHAFSWIVEDYVIGEISINDVPDSILFFDCEYLIGIREFNMSLPISDRIRVRYIDANHWDNNFIDSVEIIEKIINMKGLFKSIKGLDLHSEEYYNELCTLLSNLIGDETNSRRKLSDKWYNRITEMLEVEIISFKQRMNIYNPGSRESLMIDLCNRRFQDERKTIINCGRNHAQKKHFSGPGGEYQLIGEFIHDNFHSYSIGFSGVQGVIKHGFKGWNTEEFNVITSGKDDDLFKIVGTIQGKKDMFIPLDDSIFQYELMAMDCLKETKIKPSFQFDAYIIYHRIDVVNSMKKYNYNKYPDYA